MSSPLGNTVGPAPTPSAVTAPVGLICAGPAIYTEFVHDTLRRVRDGRPPIADLTDNAGAVALIETAYAMSPLDG